MYVEILSRVLLGLVKDERELYRYAQIKNVILLTGTAFYMSFDIGCLCPDQDPECQALGWPRIIREW